MSLRCRYDGGGAGTGHALAAMLGLGLATAIAAAAGPAPGPPATAAAGENRADRAALLDMGHDAVVDRAFVPSAERPQGEVRIVARGGRPVVQTLLYTRVLGRVLGAIREKERKNWPQGSEGHADMERYIAALDDFRRAATARRGPAEAQADRRITALIEFVDAPGGPLVAIGEAEIEGTGEAVRVRARAAPTVLPLSAAYVRRNMRLIVEDAFRLPAEEAAARLAKAGAR